MTEAEAQDQSQKIKFACSKIVTCNINMFVYKELQYNFNPEQYQHLKEELLQQKDNGMYKLPRRHLALILPSCRRNDPQNYFILT